MILVSCLIVLIYTFDRLQTSPQWRPFTQFDPCQDTTAPDSTTLAPEHGPAVLESMGLTKQYSLPSAQPDVKDETEDIDFMEEDLEEESNGILDDIPSGPRSWEEVEENESQRVSLNISSHAVPSNDSGEAAARLAWQAAALEAENQDPLGLGRIDAHGLRLVSEFTAPCFELASRYSSGHMTYHELTVISCSYQLQVRQDRSTSKPGGARRNVSPCIVGHPWCLEASFRHRVWHRF